MIFNPTSRALVREAEPKWFAKFVLRIVTLLVCIISLGLAIATFIRTLSIIWLVIPLVLSITWNLANIIVRLCRARPMHPGANVGCDLILWLMFLVAAIFCFSLSIFLVEDYGFYNGYESSEVDNNCGDYNGGSDYDENCQNPDWSELNRLAAIGIAANSFAAIAL